MSVPQRRSVLPKALAPANIGYSANGRRRRISYGFLPQNRTRYTGQDAHSFRSLNERDEEESAVGGSGGSDSASSFRSLPSTLEATDEEVESVSRWLDEERERRSMSIASSASSLRSAPNSDEELLREADRIFQRRNSYGSTECSKIDTAEAEQGSGTSSEEEEDFANEKATTASESKKLGRYSAPLVINFVLEQVFSLVCIVFAGHLGKDKMAAVSLASMIFAIVMAIYEGIATALDTLCPQAYGAGQYPMVGIQTQRCAAFSLVLYIPAAILWWYSAAFLKYIIPDEKVVLMAQEFLRVMIFAGPPYILFEVGKRYLQGQGIFDAGTLILFITAPLDVLLNWVLVYAPSVGMGWIGTAWASVINFWLTFLLLVLYVVFIDGSECWNGLSPAMWTRWDDLSKLALPGVVMLLAESMAYELLTLMASYFGTIALAAQSALSSVVSLLYMIPFALSVASSTRIASFVGSGNVDAAKIATHVGMLSCLWSSLFNALIVFVFSRQIAKLFTEDPVVQDLIVSLCPLMSLFVVLDGWGCVASGILRALGLQGIGGTINVIGYYFIAVPAAIILGFKCDMGLVGLWVGNAIGLMIIAVGETYVIQTADWNKAVEQARERNEDTEYDAI